MVVVCVGWCVCALIWEGVGMDMRFYLGRGGVG